MRINTFEKNVHTTFGGVAHELSESFLLTRHVDPALRRESPISLDDIKRLLVEKWKEDGLGDPTHWVNPYDESEIIDWTEILCRVSADIGPFMDEKFGLDWQCVDAESKLFEEIDGFSPRFKGYIDGVLVTHDKKGKEIYWLIDWKFTNFWSADKKSDIETTLQLILYKYFWSIKYGVDPKQIRCAFILAKKKAKPGKTFELVTTSVGPKTFEKGTKILRNMMTSITRGLFIKKRWNCKYCPFAGTQHCT